jgi:phenylacetate-CoA ligase
MPLIRYDTADTARAGPSICSCGSTLPCLDEVLGRTVEFFVTQDGRLVSGGTLQKLLIHCDWILSNQILQEDLDLVTVLYVVVSGKRASEEDKADIGTRMEHILGGSATITWKEVEEIPRTRNGKRPYARSLVWESRQPDDLWPLSSS